MNRWHETDAFLLERARPDQDRIAARAALQEREYTLRLRDLLGRSQPVERSLDGGRVAVDAKRVGRRRRKRSGRSNGHGAAVSGRVEFRTIRRPGKATLGPVLYGFQ